MKILTTLPTYRNDISEQKWIFTTRPGHYPHCPIIVFIRSI